MDKKNKTRRHLILSQAAQVLAYLVKVEEISDVISEEDIVAIKDLFDNLQQGGCIDIITALLVRDGHTQVELAQLKGCSSSRIHQMVARGERRMKHPIRLKVLDFEQRPPASRIGEVELNALRRYSSTFSNHVVNRLAQRGVKTIDQLLQMTPKEIEQIPGIGAVRVATIQYELATLGQALKGTTHIEILGERKIDHLTGWMHEPLRKKLESQGIITVSDLLQRRANEISDLLPNEWEHLQHNLQRFHLNLRT